MVAPRARVTTARGMFQENRRTAQENEKHICPKGKGIDPYRVPDL